MLAFKDEHGNLETDPVKALDIALTHFEKLSGDATGNSRRTDVWEQRYAGIGGPGQPRTHELCDAQVTMEEVATAVGKLKTGKAPGASGVPNEVLKCAVYVKNDRNQLVPSKFLQRLHQTLARVWDSG